MSDKYTIKQNDSFSHSILKAIEEENELYTVGAFNSKSYAELVCKLLNANDKPKVKIDKIIKNETINDLIRLKNISKKINDAGKTESKYANLIKAIESLEADDGK